MSEQHLHLGHQRPKDTLAPWTGGSLDRALATLREGANADMRQRRTYRNHGGREAEGWMLTIVH